jgi:hypothetical protein
MNASASVPKRKAPWTGRRKVQDPKARLSTIRWTAEQYATVSKAADDAGLALGTFLRTIALGDPGPRPVRRPMVEKRQLARLLGLLGNLTANCNQLAKHCNTTQLPPALDDLAVIRREALTMRSALMEALGREP